MAEYVQKQRLSAAQVFGVFTQCCEAVQHLHSMSPPLIHRDIKLENYLIAQNNKIKLCDFGSATDKILDTSKVEVREVSWWTCNSR